MDMDSVRQRGRASSQEDNASQAESTKFETNLADTRYGMLQLKGASLDGATAATDKLPCPAARIP